MFNPIVTSLRGIQQASELKNVQKKLGCARASLGSLSEATSVFDAERLQEIIGELGKQLQPLAQDKRLADIKQTITLVDGSLIAALRTNKKPTLRTYEMICFYFIGLADEEELLAHIAKLESQTA